MSDHGHPSAREKHEAAALERVLHHRRQVVGELAAHEQRVRDIERRNERRRIAGVLVQDSVETDFEGCVG